MCAVRTTLKLICRKMPDFIIAPNLGLLNIFDFSPADYRILAMLQEWVCQHSMRDVDKLRQHLIDRKTIMDRVIDQRWLRLRVWVKARGGHLEHLTKCNVLLLHWILGPYVFILYMMFYLRLIWWWYLSLRDVTDVCYDMCTHAAFHKAL